MSDDIILGSQVSSSDVGRGVEFDPNAVESDIFLGDPKDIIPELDLDDEMTEDE